MTRLPACQPRVTRPGRPPRGNPAGLSVTARSAWDSGKTEGHGGRGFIGEITRGGRLLGIRWGWSGWQRLTPASMQAAWIRVGSIIGVARLVRGSEACRRSRRGPWPPSRPRQLSRRPPLRDDGLEFQGAGNLEGVENLGTVLGMEDDRFHPLA